MKNIIALISVIKSGNPIYSYTSITSKLHTHAYRERERQKPPVTLENLVTLCAFVCVTGTGRKLRMVQPQCLEPTLLLTAMGLSMWGTLSMP